MTDAPRRTLRLEDLARQAGVSVSTVSRALNGGGAVNSETRRRIQELAESSDYDVPARRSRLSRGAGAQTITVVLAPSHHRTRPVIDTFSLGLVGGIVSALLPRRLDLSISHLVPDDSRALTRFAQEFPHDGIIFLGQSPLHESFNKLAETGRKFVVWGAAVPNQAYCAVGSDNRKGGQRATSHLVRLGRRKIGFLGHLDTLELQQRHEGYLAALDEAGLEVDPALHRSCWLEPDSAVEAVDGLLDQGAAFDALVCASDLVALGAMRALMRRGLSVPTDVALVGYDDIELAAHAHPALTTIRQDPIKAGRVLVGKLLGLLDGGQAMSEQLTADLIVRETCGA
ncbi:LacI family DNA-binding transcriptional regulator [Sphingobium yanoikuyae]|uniref:LacI family DNA-binding transcriptional regulator n=1 Tax=Sphingobium yanoikuyae TaxID=13690 RepID=UPI00240F7649|nr:LacI family DNA-binding transcriptional regulator [Sphingobium yanoikuyae]MDG2515698.1 LacI family DNA-binding transcriptional regulator [Sphingobium yanoikuyae]